MAGRGRRTEGAREEAGEATVFESGAQDEAGEATLFADPAAAAPVVEMEERTVFAGGGPAALPEPRAPERTDGSSSTPPLRRDRTENLSDRTGFAQESLRVAVLLAHRLGKVQLGRPGLKLHIPEPGLSTDGGVKARLPITLSRGGGRGSTVLGWLDLGRRAVELRALALLERQHLARFHEPFDLGTEEHDQLVSEARGFADDQDLAFRLVEREGRAPVERAEDSEHTRPLAPLLRRVFWSAVVLWAGVLVGLLIAGHC